MQNTKLTAEQEKVLLRKHLTGSFPGQRWSTIQALLHAGMLANVPRTFRNYSGETIVYDVVVTAKGKAYCDENHARITL